MFCQNCGTKNQDDALFCEACGTKLIKEPGKGAAMGPGKEPGKGPAMGPGKEPGKGPAMGSGKAPGKGQRASGKKVPVLLIVWIAEAVALLAVLAGAFFIGKSGTGPEKTALNYFINVANGDWEKAYEKLDVEESSFINGKMFAMANQYNDLGAINQCEVMRRPQDLFLQETESALGKTVTVVFRTRGDTQDRYFDVNVSRMPRKKYLLFDDWKVGTSNLISRNYTISVPVGADAAVDGLALGEEYLMSQEPDAYGNVNYVIPEIFSGIHTITVSMEDREDITETVQISYDNDAYYADRMKYRKEMLTELIGIAGADMRNIYQAAVEGRTLKTLEGLFTTDAENFEEITYAYEALLSDLNEGNTAPVSISFSNLAGSSRPDETVVALSFDYRVDYTYEDWWSGQQERDSYEGSDTWYFYFVKENGAWVLQNLGCEELYY